VPHRVRAGFLNGLNALAHATVNCFPMILISGSSEREVVDLQQGDYEEMDQLAIAKPVAKAAYRVLHADDIGVGVARAIRAAVSGRPGGVYLDLPAKLFAQTIDAESGQEDADQGRRSGAEADPRARRGEARARAAEGREEAADHSRQGRRVRPGRRRHQALVEKSGIPYLPMSMAKGLLPDTHEQCARRRARSSCLAPTS
jgi:oxalyl-CoA decarboxylase